MELKGKNIVLCITGGIAAYKAVYLASFLIKKGAHVYPVLTKNALKFITPLTLKTITRKKVSYKMFDESDFIPHISLADLADIVLVAPATANVIAKFAHGIADDLVSTLLLSAKGKKIIVPAMNTNMYLNPVTQSNIGDLEKNGYFIMKPDTGLLACGVEGIGKFPEAKKIYEFILDNCTAGDNKSFLNKKILITLGGTIEDIDPVRYISNRSSGRMGFGFAGEFFERGGDVTVIAGNVSEKALEDFRNRYDCIKIIQVRSAKEMKDAVTGLENDFDVYFMAAAVADYTVDYNENKIKKNDESLVLKLKKTDDILKGMKKRPDAVYVGFAAESDNLLENARKKLTNKNLDFLIANNVKGEKSAIGSDNAEVFLLNKWNDEVKKYDYSAKKNLAGKVLDDIYNLLSI